MINVRFLAEFSPVAKKESSRILTDFSSVPGQKDEKKYIGKKIYPPPCQTTVYRKPIRTFPLMYCRNHHNLHCIYVHMNSVYTRTQITCVCVYTDMARTGKFEKNVSHYMEKYMCYRLHHNLP